MILLGLFYRPKKEAIGPQNSSVVISIMGTVRRDRAAFSISIKEAPMYFLHMLIYHIWGKLLPALPTPMNS
jgi:hypothetical protein